MSTSPNHQLRLKTSTFKRPRTIVSTLQWTIADSLVSIYHLIHPFIISVLYCEILQCSLGFVPQVCCRPDVLRFAHPTTSKYWRERTLPCTINYDGTHCVIPVDHQSRFALSDPLQVNRREKRLTCNMFRSDNSRIFPYGVTPLRTWTNICRHGKCAS